MLNFIFVQGDAFQMGSEHYGDEKPIHDVIVPDFYISKYLVTQALWESVMGKNPSSFKGTNHPVENVSWNDVQEFIKKLNKQSDKTYRLPSEAEWEYAARGGNKSNGYLYAGSNNLDEVGWYNGNSNSKTHPVGEKKANELGLYDMSGNVWEWCEDVWHDNYKDAPKDGSAWMSGGNQDRRVVRGGSWDLNVNLCRSTNRFRDYPDNGIILIGFRLAYSV